MKKLLQSNLMFIMLLALSLSACGEKESPEETNYKEYTLSRQTEYGNDWIYFSFDKGREVTGITEDNRAESLEWDIAFNKANMRTNGGASGKGKGGAVEMVGKSTFAEVTEQPASGVKADVIIQITKDISSFPPPLMDTPGSQVLGNAIKFSGPPPKYTIKDTVFVLRTAMGRYVKFKVISYHNAKSESGYVTFRYAFLN